LALSAAGGQPQTPDLSKPAPIKSYRNLFKMLNQKQPRYSFIGGSGGPAVFSTAIEGTATVALPGAGDLAGVTGTGAAGGSGQKAGGASTTNVQVAGVDEADIVKNDGEFIYHVSRERVLITKAFPDTALEVKAKLEFGSEFQPLELFIDGDLLVVIGSSIRTRSVEKDVNLSPLTVKALVLNVADKSKIEKVREVEVDGDYLTSRKIDSSVYLVTRKYPDFYFLPFIGETTFNGPGIGLAAQTRKAKREPRRRNKGLVPALRDTAAQDKPVRIDPKNVFYFPDFSEPNYLIVAGFDLNKPTEAADVKAFLGAGEAVYASRKNLYVAESKYHDFILNDKEEAAPPSQTTALYRFSLDSGKVSFSLRGEVLGTVLNQFSMDEHGDTFRVATTTRDFFFGGASANNLYVMNADMKVIGKLENLAPGEQIFSARFMGSRCYVVTFRRVDPLFVISLANPEAPAVLGQLKIPGFSDYLHPYDDNHIIGFGKDSEDGLYQGMKVACFDVSDVTTPLQKYAISIGDRGTSSEVLYNHKALLFDKAKDLIAFPISVMEIKNKTANTPAWTYGEPVFQGAHVYTFTLETGFILRKAITHESAQPKPAVDFFFDYGSIIRRLLYIDANLYSVSDSKIHVHDLNTLDEKRIVDLP